MNPPSDPADLPGRPTQHPTGRQSADRSTTGPPARLVVASSNPGKIAELVELLEGRFSVEPRPAELPETIEDGATLEANATKKAVEVSAFTGATALADDTGLFVAALDGRPGVHTARYAGERATNAENVAKLLRELAGLADGARSAEVTEPGDATGAPGMLDRTAEFRTVVAVASPDGAVQLSSGVVTGYIAERRSGADGFGYDPVFVPAKGDGRTFAEMTSAEKNRISHRGRALRAMLDQLDQLDQQGR